MDRGAIIDRLDGLCAAARARMPERAVSNDTVFAEVMWMTDAEVREVHQLKSALPTNGQDRAAAVARLKEKRAARKIVV